MQPVVVRGFAELRDAGITRTGYELHELLFTSASAAPVIAPDKDSLCLLGWPKVAVLDFHTC